MTFVATVVLWGIPRFVLWYYADQSVYLGALTYRSYRLLGGAFGGLVAGWFTSLDDPSRLLGGYAAFVGTVIVGSGYFVTPLAVDTLVIYSSPPIVYASVRTALVHKRYTLAARRLIDDDTASDVLAGFLNL